MLCYSLMVTVAIVRWIFCCFKGKYRNHKRSHFWHCYISVPIYILCLLFSEMEQLADFGVTLPPNMQGLTDEQIEELKLKDEWGERCVPQGGSMFNKDTVGCRSGQGCPFGAFFCHYVKICCFRIKKLFLLSSLNVLVQVEILVFILVKAMCIDVLGWQQSSN